MIFGSATIRLNLSQPLEFKPTASARVGDVVVVEVLSENHVYPNLELPDGTPHRITVGDRIVGVLGSRQALRGFVGHAPTALEAGMELALLNMGGVIGHFVDSTTALGEPARVRYLGTAVDEKGVINLDRAALPVSETIHRERPVVLVIGTCMNVGKTVTAARLVEMAANAGHRVGAAKVSGVGAVKDLYSFKNAGAIDVKSFLDCGLPSTVDADDLVPVVKTVINHVDGDLVIVEFGDGIMGHYKVEGVLTDPEVMKHVAAVVVCAGDLMAAYGAKVYLDQLGVGFSVFSGLVSENVSGSSYIEEKWNIPALNGLKHAEKLFESLNLPQPATAKSLAVGSHAPSTGLVAEGISG